jgi:hypothetical protein
MRKRGTAAIQYDDVGVRKRMIREEGEQEFYVLKIISDKPSMLVNTIRLLPIALVLSSY